MIPVIRARKHWVCPNCAAEDWTTDPRPHSRFHTCAGLRNLTAPMVLEGTKAKVEVREREDYVNGDRVQTDGNGRPVMSVVTTRDDGQDVAVFAPTATAKGS